MCELCSDVIVHFAWRQLALDESHVVRYTACECRCGYTLLAVTIEVTVDVDS
jgi:hypothetical protein